MFSHNGFSKGILAIKFGLFVSYCQCFFKNLENRCHNIVCFISILFPRNSIIQKGMPHGSNIFWRCFPRTQIVMVNDF